MFLLGCQIKQPAYSTPVNPEFSQSGVSNSHYHPLASVYIFTCRKDKHYYYFSITDTERCCQKHKTKTLQDMTQ